VTHARRPPTPHASRARRMRGTAVVCSNGPSATITKRHSGGGGSCFRKNPMTGRPARSSAGECGCPSAKGMTWGGRARRSTVEQGRSPRCATSTGCLDELIVAAPPSLDRLAIHRTYKRSSSTLKTGTLWLRRPGRAKRSGAGARCACASTAQQGPHRRRGRDSCRTGGTPALWRGDATQPSLQAGNPLRAATFKPTSCRAGPGGGVRIINRAGAS